MIRAALRPLLLPLLRRRPDEVERRARAFAISRPENLSRVRLLGDAFLGGFNAMLEEPDLEGVARRAEGADVHWRPFFYEGAAMGYLPRAWLRGDASRARAERDLLAMNAGHLYLYYVGLGFWYAFRHPRRPWRLQELAPHVDRIYLPLCYDGFGFKVGFYGDREQERGALPQPLEACPAEHRFAAVQGYGRASFFVHMEDPEGFTGLKESFAAGRRHDLETGRSLALAFTGIDRPGDLLAHLDAATEEVDLAARLLGVTWALTARQMNDPAYFSSCLERAPGPGRELLIGLPEQCRRALRSAGSYAAWQEATRVAALDAWRTAARGVRP